MTDDEGGHRSAIVWSVPEEDAAGWLSLNDEDFAAEAEAAMGGFLGKIAMLAPRSSYPLGFHHAAQMTAKRLALAGDAAHAIHPIAGQGLNLGFRDAAALAQVLVEGARLGMDLGDRQLLDRYQQWRSLDALSVAFATDSLTRIYGVPGKTASAIRRFGMGLVGRISPIRNRLMNEARGTSGELPLLLRGSADLTTEASVRSRLRRSPRRDGTASAGPADRRGRRASAARAAPAWRRCRTARPGRSH